MGGGGCTDPVLFNNNRSS